VQRSGGCAAGRRRVVRDDGAGPGSEEMRHDDRIALGRARGWNAEGDRIVIDVARNAIDVDVDWKRIGILQESALVDVDDRELAKRLDRRASCDLGGDVLECLGARRLGARDDHRRTEVRILANSLFEWDGA